MDGKTQVPKCLVVQCGAERGNTAMMQLATIVGPEFTTVLQENIHMHEEERLYCQLCERSNFVLKFPSQDFSTIPVMLVCQNCHQLSCLVCHELIPVQSIAGESHTCFTKELDLLRLHVQDPANEVRPCPHCFKITHRYTGCAHMVCSGRHGCQSPWCWVCLDKCHHNDTVCRTRRTREPRNCALLSGADALVRKSLQTGSSAMHQTVQGTCMVLWYPYQARKRMQARREEKRRAKMFQSITGEGIEVFVFGQGAGAIVQRFAYEKRGDGAWDQGCFTSSLQCVQGNLVLMRVHSHAKTGERNRCCGVEVHGSVSIAISTAEVDVASNAQDYISDRCRMLIDACAAPPS